MKNALRFGSFLVRNRLVSDKEVNEALQNQSIIGGRLGTNLVESQALTLSGLEDALARFYGVPCVSSDYLQGVNQQLLQSLPMRLIRKYKFIPLRKMPQELIIAAMDPADPEMLRDISGVVGLKVKPLLCSEIRLAFYLQEYYGLEADLRFRPLFLRYLQSAPGAHSAKKSKEDLMEKGFKPLESGEELTAAGFEDELLRQTLARTQPAVTPAPAKASAPSPAAQAPVIPASPWLDFQVFATLPEKSQQKIKAVIETKLRQNQLLDIEDLKTVLPELNDRTHIIEISLRYICQFVETGIFFVSNTGMVSGWEGRSRNPMRKFSRDLVRLIVFPLTTDSIFKTVNESKNHFHGWPTPNAINSRLLSALGLTAEHEILLIPVYVKKRLVNFIFIDNGLDNLSQQQVSLMLDLGRWLTKAYEHIILIRKKDFQENLKAQ